MQLCLTRSSKQSTRSIWWYTSSWRPHTLLAEGLIHY
jgi:hypothetical protein